MMNYKLALELATILKNLTPEGVDAEGHLSVDTKTVVKAIFDWVSLDPHDDERISAATHCANFMAGTPDDDDDE
mgnify:CR=1 FL=1